MSPATWTTFPPTVSRVGTLGDRVRVVRETMYSARMTPGTYVPVNAANGAVTQKLPVANPANAGMWCVVKKTDSSTNAVTISGSIRGTAGTITLSLSGELVAFIADAAGSWWDIAGHKTLASLDARYVQSVSAAGAVEPHLMSGLILPQILGGSVYGLFNVTYAAILTQTEVVMRCVGTPGKTVKNVNIYVGTAQAAANLMATLYDVGDTTSGTVTSQWNSGSKALTSQGWLAMGDPNYTIPSHGHFDIGWRADSNLTTGQIATGAFAGGAAASSLPSSVGSINTVLPKIVSSYNPGNFTPLASIADSSLAALGNATKFPVFFCQET